MAEFTDKHLRDMASYHEELETFSKVTGLNTDRSSLSRAQKARGKLLKLLDSQFYELGTDVYDEVRRRINENQEQPDYLLPKAGFHVKRNQARQKLSSLTQARFGDLVNDILFETKRRGFDQVIPPKDEISKSDNVDLNFSNPQKSKPQENTTAPNSPLPSTSSLQTSEIIPRKASMAWSSDEENEENEENVDSQKVEPDSINIEHRDDDPHSKFHHHDGSDLNDVPVTPLDGNSSSVFPNDGLSDLPKPTIDTQNLGVNGSSPSNSIFSPIDKYYAFQGPERPNSVNPKLNSTVKTDTETDFNANLSPQLPTTAAPNLPPNLASSSIDTKEASTHIHGRSGRESPEGKQASNEHLKKELTQVSLQISSLSIENEKLKQKLAELELNSKTRQSMPSFFQSDDDMLNDFTVSNLIAPEGQVSWILLSQLNKHIKQFFESSIIDSSDVGQTLFQILLEMSNCAHQIIESVDIIEFNDQIVLIKASLSHLISSVRYFSVYGKLIPVLTIQAAASELIFAICRLLSACKIKASTAANGTDTESLKNTDMLSNTSSPLKEANASYNNSFTSKTEIPNYLKEDLNEVSPVKPLKITQKASRASTPKPSGYRTPSHPNLFSSVVDKTPRTKSHRQMESNSQSLNPIITDTSSTNKDNANNTDEVASANTYVQLPSVGLGLSTSKNKSNSDESLNTKENIPTDTADASPIADDKPPVADENLPDDTENSPSTKAMQSVSPLSESSNYNNPSYSQPQQIQNSTSNSNSTPITSPKVNTLTPAKVHKISSPMVKSEAERSPALSSEPQMPDKQENYNAATAINDSGRDVDKPPHLIENNQTTSPKILTSAQTYVPNYSHENANEMIENESEISDDLSNFDIEQFDIENPDNSLPDLLTYVEHQTVDVISTIQSLLASIKEPNVTKIDLKSKSSAINKVILKMVDATSVSMDQIRNAHLKEHGGWVVQSLNDCGHRMSSLCDLTKDGVANINDEDTSFADKQFKQRLAGIAFDIAKCTKELVKSIEEASLKQEIDQLNAN